MGRPSIDPEPMIRMLLIGYCFGLRSERRLCDEVHLNLAYRWFCRLGLEDRVPDHSTFSLNRHGRFREARVLRSVVEEVVRRCMGVGLVGGEGFAIDASVMEADASRYKGVPPGRPRPTSGCGSAMGSTISRRRRCRRKGRPRARLGRSAAKDAPGNVSWPVRHGPRRRSARAWRCSC